ncbi:hypothetical protein [Stieleria varia]|uniref:Uncharacterized protein n=1 Tax=Stieleria varia TaxID=2528005 RepID=A0A5C6B059_9BACT|nr:hypothetical protein [Stieleria varia]TWU04839.1 hypothetical protein Pla52n_28840 [Stieleria varia]
MFRAFAILLFVFAVPTFASAAEIVKFQLKDWKAQHIHDTKKADKITDTLKKIGCEVERAEHNGHVDVKYRCPKERQMTLKTHEEASQWEKWLKGYGFTVSHSH